MCDINIVESILLVVGQEAPRRPDRCREEGCLQKEAGYPQDACRCKMEDSPQREALHTPSAGPQENGFSPSSSVF